MSMTKTLSVIGAGIVGRTLAILWSRAGRFSLGGVLNSSLNSAERAVAEIGVGKAVASYGDLPPSDIYMIATRDDAIESVCGDLAGSRDLNGSIVFHCSGSLSSDALQSAKQAGAEVASVHPVKGFPDVARAIDSFVGTHCGCDGDEGALKILKPAFEGIGGRVFDVDPKQKTLYHAAIVFAGNYMNVLFDVGLRCYAKAGVDSGLATQLLANLLKIKLDNIERLGPAGAMTGPIERGDVEVVRRHLQAFDDWDGDLADLYCLLGMQALRLTESTDAHEQIRSVLRRHESLWAS